MATDLPAVRLDRIALTKTQLRATEIMLYRMADLVDRLLVDGIPYTKIEGQGDAATAIAAQQQQPQQGGA